jgi:hypothetical protein
MRLIRLSAERVKQLEAIIWARRTKYRCGCALEIPDPSPNPNFCLPCYKALWRHALPKSS